MRVGEEYWQPFAERSGLIAPMTVAPLAAAPPPPPPSSPASARPVEDRIASIERSTAANDRILISDGTRTRVAIGRQDDGKYGLRVWSSTGALVYDYTSS